MEKDGVILPDYTPENRPGVLATGHAQSSLALSILFPLLATFSVSARVYCRRWKGNRWGWDDWLNVIALVVYYGETAAQFIAIFAGRSGSHMQYVSPSQRLLDYKLMTIIPLMNAFNMTLIRCSVCLLFLNIFTTRTYRRLAYANMTSVIACGLYSIFFLCFRCDPPSKTFNPLIEGSCVDPTVVYEGTPIWGLVCDVISWTLPIHIVLKLNMPLSDRIALCLVFCVGGALIGVDIVRVVTVYTLDYSDMTYSQTIAGTVGFVEVGIAIMVACSPKTRPLFHAWITSMKTNTDRCVSKVKSISIKSISIRGSYQSDMMALAKQRNDSWDNGYHRQSRAPQLTMMEVDTSFPNEWDIAQAKIRMSNMMRSTDTVMMRHSDLSGTTMVDSNDSSSRKPSYGSDVP